MVDVNSKLIAKNTFFLYIRMFFILLMSLFTSRIILQVLGEEDFGIYGVIGSVVAVFSILKYLFKQ